MRIVRAITTGSLLVMALAASGQEPLSITGTATYRERMALPPNAVFEATLEDVSRADAPSRVIKIFRNEKPGNPPFPFTIAYDPSQIDEDHTYVVRVRVTIDGKLLFTTTQRYQVLTQGHGNEIGTMIVMQRVSKDLNMSGPRPAVTQSSSADEPLRETYWKLIELDGKPVTAADQQQEAHLIFRTQDRRLTGSGGCNRLMGNYLVEGSSMHLKGIASTMMACLHGTETEQAFIGALNKVESWKISGKYLELFGAGETLLARFEATAMK